MRKARRTAVLAGTGTVAALSFAVLSVAVAKRSTSRLDRAVRPRLKLRKGHPVRRGADALAPLGKWYVTVPASALLASWLFTKERRRAAGAVLGANAAAVAAAKVFDHLLPQPPAPPGHRARSKPVYPSGHALNMGTLTMTAAYVLRRERMVGAAPALVAALAIPLASAGGKLIEEKHWASDVLGGMLAAVSLSSFVLATYEARR